MDALLDGAGGLQADQTLPRNAGGDVGFACPVRNVRRHQTRLPRASATI